MKLNKFKRNLRDDNEIWNDIFMINVGLYFRAYNAVEAGQTFVLVTFCLTKIYLFFLTGFEERTILIYFDV